MGKHVWGYWDCPFCGTTEIRGDNKLCPHCGSPIPPDTKFRLIEGKEKEYVEEEQKETEANWICEYCDTQNSMKNEYCGNCGSPRYDAHRDYFGEKDFGKPAWEQSEQPPPKSPEPEPKPEPAETVKRFVSSARERTKRRNKYRRKALLRFGATLMVWLSISALVLAMFLPIVSVSSEVTGFEWERSIAIETYKNVDEDGWTLPHEANLHYTREEIKEYVQVLDHYETRTREYSEQVFDGYDTDYRDLGNGQFEQVQTPRYRTEWRTEYYEEPVYRSEPVYATKYYYDIDKWVKTSSIDTAGSDHEAEWGNAEGYPKSVSSPSYGDKRQGERKESYWIKVKTKKGKTTKQELKYSEWCDYQKGDTIKYKVNIIRYITKGG